MMSGKSIDLLWVIYSCQNFFFFELEFYIGGKEDGKMQVVYESLI